jgi:hypothetical protein
MSCPSSEGRTNVVVRSWHRDLNGEMVYRRRTPAEAPKPMLEFVAIQRRDTKEWALPGVRDLP